MENERIEKALEFHKKRYNCCQAVLCAFADKLDIAPEQLFKISEAFGGGMGSSTEGACGALVAATMILSLQCSDGNLEQPATKAQTYARERDLIAAFREKAGAILCKDIKGIETGIPLTSCDQCIMAGVEIILDAFDEMK